MGADDAEGFIGDIALSGAEVVVDGQPVDGNSEETEVSAEEVGLTDDDLTVLRNLLTLLEDDGLRLALRVETLIDAEKEAEAVIEALLEEVEELCDMALGAWEDGGLAQSGVVQAASSICYIAQLLQDLPGLAIPSDFVPDDDLISKIRGLYFADLRSEAAERRR